MECEYISQDENETALMALKRKLTNLQQSYSRLNELIAYLKCTPESVAQEILRRLRNTEDPGKIIESVKYQMRDYCVISEPTPTLGVQPQTQAASITGFTVPYPKPYYDLHSSDASIVITKQTANNLTATKHDLSSCYPHVFNGSTADASFSQVAIAYRALKSWSYSTCPLQDSHQSVRAFD